MRSCSGIGPSWASLSLHNFPILSSSDLSNFFCFFHTFPPELLDRKSPMFSTVATSIASSWGSSLEPRSFILATSTGEIMLMLLSLFRRIFKDLFLAADGAN